MGNVQATFAPPVEVSRISKVYPGGVRALSEASFRIEAGERAALLGPNGAGKTTLIRLLTGGLRPTEGWATLFGHPVGGPRFLEAKRRVGIVPQSAGMYRELNGREYLELARRLFGRGDPGKVIEPFDLGEFVDRPMATLSGGQQRRLLLAAAVMPEPELLLLDEPSAGLDPVATREVHAFLREMIRGRAVLLCTHNLLEAEALCESVVILRAGKVLLHEPIEELRAQVAPTVALAAAQGAVRLLAALEAKGVRAALDGDEVRATIPDPRAQVPVLLRALLADGLDVYEARIVQARLEDVFHDVVGGRDVRA